MTATARIYDWDSIRVRYARGESSRQISKSLNGKPSRQGIMRRVKKENWLRADDALLDLARSLSICKVSDISGFGNDKRSAPVIATIFAAILVGASEELAARAAGICPRTFYNWKKKYPDFAHTIEILKARKAVSWIAKIDGAKDWRAADRLLQVAHETRDEWSRKRYNKPQTIAFNFITRDKVPVKEMNSHAGLFPEATKSDVKNAGVTIDHETIDVDVPGQEVTDTVTTPQAKPPKLKLISNSPFPPRDPEAARERDRLEKERMERCWQGDDWRERQTMDEHCAREQRLALGITITPMGLTTGKGSQT